MVQMFAGLYICLQKSTFLLCVFPTLSKSAPKLSSVAQPKGQQVTFAERE